MSTKLKEPKKQKPAKKTKPVIVKEQIQAPYVFIPDEILKMGVEMRGHMTQADELRDQLKQSTADFKLRIGNHESSVKQLRIKLDSGQETRPVEAIVKFNFPKSGDKTFLHPDTDEEIRTERMAPADFQHPLFKPDPKTGAEIVAPKGDVDISGKGEAATKKGKKGKGAEPGENAGTTNLGDAIGAAASITNAPKIDLYLAEIDDHAKLTRAFRKAAKSAGWSEAQVGVMIDAMRACDGVQAMKDTLAPHVINNPSEEPPPL